MADYDKDGDVRMETQYITENKPTQQVAATTSQNVNTAVQQTDIRVESTSRVSEDPQNALSQNSASQLPPRPGKVPFDHQLPVDSEVPDKAHQLAEVKRVELEESARLLEQSSKKLDGALREIKRLNTIIFKIGMPKAEPPDAELSAQFCGIRDNIFGLVRAHFESPKVTLRRQGRPYVISWQERWLGCWNYESPELRIYRAQGAIFDIINGIFFERPFFVLGDLKLEEQLNHFEQLLEESPEISKVDRVEWRKRTVTAAKALKIPSEIVERAAIKIFDTLEPARTPGATDAKDYQLNRDLRAICDKAYRLSLIFHESKAIFKVVIPADNVDVLVDNAEMELIAMADGRAPLRPPKVLFTAFGCLRKTALSPDEKEDIVTLEKARVVGYEVRGSSSLGHKR